MAEDKKKSFPRIPRANWFSLRQRFKAKPPSEVTVSYLASALGIGEPSAANILPPLKALGLVGNDNKLTDLAFDWRDDSKYAKACETILEKTYPSEVRELYHDPSASIKDVTKWFANYLRIGEPAAEKIAGMYMLLLEADPNKTEASQRPKSTVKAQSPARPQKQAKTAVKQVPSVAKPAALEEKGDSGSGSAGRGFTPKLHVDIQIHISPDSSAEQIDKIFESMAKYLPLKG